MRHNKQTRQHENDLVIKVHFVSFTANTELDVHVDKNCLCSIDNHNIQSQLYSEELPPDGFIQLFRK